MDGTHAWIGGGDRRAGGARTIGSNGRSVNMSLVMPRSRRPRLAKHSADGGSATHRADHGPGQARVNGPAGHSFDSRAIDVTGLDAASIDWPRVRGALVGASLHLGRHQKTADRFVRANWVRLNEVPSAFSVSMAAASKTALMMAVIRLAWLVR